MMGALQVVLNQGGQFGWLSLTTIGLFVLATVFAIVFVKQETTTSHASVDFGLEQRKFYFTPGESMAAVDNWEIELTGKCAHGAMPELSIDPVVAGSSLVMALQSIVSRNVSPQSQAVVTIGAFQSGNAGNVVAQSAILRLSIRTRTDKDRDMVLGRVGQITEHQAASYGCTFEIRQGVAGALLVNDEAETARAAGIAQAAFGEDRVVYPGPTFLA